MTAPQSDDKAGRGIYVASRVRHADMWKRHRAEGAPIISSWIDEAGEGETPDFGELWARIRKEIASCRALVFYGTAEDAPWKGALVEVGMALAMGKRVYLVYTDKLDGRTQRPLGSWILDHDNVIRVPFVEVALWRVNADNIAPRSECVELSKVVADNLRYRIKALQGDHIQGKQADAADRYLIDSGAAGMRTMVLELIDELTKGKQ